MDKKTKKNQTLVWLAVGIITAGMSVFGYFVVAKYASDSSISAQQSGLCLGWLALGAAMASIVCAVSIFKVKKWWKLISILCLVICLLIAGMACFGYVFSKYGSSY